MNDPLSTIHVERRRERRIKAPHTGELTIVELGVQSGLLLDVCGGGIAIQAVFPTKVGNGLRIQFCLPLTDDTIDSEAKVVWVDGVSQTGLEFSNLEPSAERSLRAWLERQAQNQEPSFRSDFAPLENNPSSAVEPGSAKLSAVPTPTAEPASGPTFQHKLVELIMRSIHEVLRQKEIELQQMVDQAVREKEVQLRELQTTLRAAHELVNSLLECEGETSIHALPEARSH